MLGPYAVTQLWETIYHPVITARRVFVQISFSVCSLLLIYSFQRNELWQRGVKEIAKAQLSIA